MKSFDKFTLSLIFCASLAALSACGGGASPAEEPVKPKAVSGKMIDGYVQGATVFCDANDNGHADSGEERTITASNGAYTLVGGCSGSVVGFGGIDTDTGHEFRGVLKTPAGSAVMTPATTMLVGTGMSKEALAAALGLPSSVDVTQIDIADGANQDLRKRTLALQQVVDRLVGAATSLTYGEDPASQLKYRTAYSDIISGIAKNLAKPNSGQLIAPSGTVDTQTLVNAIATVPLISSKNITAVNLSELAGNLAAEAHILIKSGDVELKNLVTNLQSPAKQPLSTTATTDYLSMTSDSIFINDSVHRLAALKDGIEIPSLQTIGFSISVTGSPAAEVFAPMALSILEQGGSGRILNLLIEKVAFKIDASKQLTVSVPAGTKVHAYGRTSNGSVVNLTITDLEFTPVTVEKNALRLNYSNIVKKVIASADNTTKATASAFLDLKGNFDFTVATDKALNIRLQDGVALSTATISIPNTSQSVTGPSFAGRVSIK
ncbi:hypothetical protein ACG0Z6_02180 [Roseateles sp. BYS180W]|uniref:Carboxypeptidase regulatory-like domain-containing protein n=1 Tax=Roseateles rivi TaxID=3299028 RepID=A0ABW7FRU3_9BURK